MNLPYLTVRFQVSTLPFPTELLYFSGYSNCTMMMSNDICPPLPNSAYTKCKKDILVRGDVTDDVTDIVEKFIKVAHENNKVRENARENIR